MIDRSTSIHYERCMFHGVGEAVRAFAFAVLVLTAAANGAQASGGLKKCEDRSQVVGVLKVSQTWLGNTHCAVSVLPDVSGMEYRQYLFQDNGLFTVHVSTNGPEHESTGSRNFFLFPRRRLVGFEALPQGRGLNVSMSNGSRVHFDGKFTRISSFSGAEIKEATSVSMANYGGVEFLRYEGILLDTGWSVYETSYSDPERSSLFRDARNQYCTAKNTELFDYGEGHPHFRFETDSELAAFLASKCPNLDLSSIRSPR